MSKQKAVGNAPDKEKNIIWCPLCKNEGVDEAMKRRDQLYWVGRMNSIRNRAEEIVLREVICV